MSGTILLERNLPLIWTPLEPGASALYTEQNQLILTLLDNLEDSLHHKPDGDAVNEIPRIEAKLNVIMHLLGQLLQDRQSSQSTESIRFSSDTLAWQVQQPLPGGSRLLVTLYPDPGVPLAMRFAAEVIDVRDHWMEVDMQGLAEDELAIWSRWVFRQHRRQVAQARSQASDKIRSD